MSLLFTRMVALSLFVLEPSTEKGKGPSINDVKVSGEGVEDFVTTELRM